MSFTKKRLSKQQEVESKNLKIKIFPKGFQKVHGFGENLAIFPSFNLRQIRPEKCFTTF